MYIFGKERRFLPNEEKINKFPTPNNSKIKWVALLEIVPSHEVRHLVGIATENENQRSLQDPPATTKEIGIVQDLDPVPDPDPEAMTDLTAVEGTVPEADTRSIGDTTVGPLGDEGDETIVPLQAPAPARTHLGRHQ